MNSLEMNERIGKERLDIVLDAISQKYVCRVLKSGKHVKIADSRSAFVFELHELECKSRLEVKQIILGCVSKFKKVEV
jgi:hypothetical protein